MVCRCSVGLLVVIFIASGISVIVSVFGSIPLAWSVVFILSMFGDSGFWVCSGVGCVCVGFVGGFGRYSSADLAP